MLDDYPEFPVYEPDQDRIKAGAVQFGANSFDFSSLAITTILLLDHATRYLDIKLNRWRRRDKLRQAVRRCVGRRCAQEKEGGDDVRGRDDAGPEDDGLQFSLPATFGEFQLYLS